MSDTTDARTIAPDTAEELHDADNGEMAGEWCREADIRTGSSRWMERRRLVLRHDDGTLWGLPYAVGLTENQDSDYPWRDATGPLALTQMWRTERLAVRYATRPPADQHLPQPLVDRVYDSLLAALGEHDLILCPTTETGPDNGIESGHVLGISERIADAVLVEPAREVG